MVSNKVVAAPREPVEMGGAAERTLNKAVRNALCTLRCLWHQGAHGGVPVPEVQPPVRRARRVRRAPAARALPHLRLGLPAQRRRV